MSHTLRHMTAILLLCPPLCHGQSPQLILQEEEGGTTSETYELVWPTKPGIRYEAERTAALPGDWSVMSVLPDVATSVVGRVGIDAGEVDQSFFRVSQVDEQPPEVVEWLPGNGDFSVRRFSPIEVKLMDATGVDESTIRFTVGTLGTFGVSDSQVTYSNQVVRFDAGGGAALGGWGETVQVSLVVADPSAYAATNECSFTLELEPQVVSNLFVFGSPEALGVGQQIGEIPTRALAEQWGPIPRNGSSSSWAIDGVYSNRIDVTYTNAPPPIGIDTYLANLTPSREEEIFYRKVTSVTDDATEHQLTLYTVDVDLEEMVDQGSVATSSDTIVLDFDSGRIAPGARSREVHVRFDPLGFSLDGARMSILEDGFMTTLGDVTLGIGSGETLTEIAAEELHWWLTPSIRASLDLDSSGLLRFEGAVRGDLNAAIVMHADVLLAGVFYDLEVFDLPEALEPSTWVLIGAIGGLPIYAEISLDLALTAEVNATASAQARAGIRQQSVSEFGLNYRRDRDPAIDWIYAVRLAPTETIWEGIDVSGELELKLKLEPSISFLVYGLAGSKASIAPSGGVVIDINPPDPLTGTLEADISLNLEPDGPALEWLRPKPSLELTIWEDDWHLFPDLGPFAFTTVPVSQTVEEGADARFSCTVNRSASTGVTYQWYHNGSALPFETHDYLDVLTVHSYHEGEYYVRAKTAGETLISNPVVLKVTSSDVDPFTPTGFAYVPAGAFTMGSPDDELKIHGGDEVLHPVTLTRALYMQKTEITNRQMADVMNWAYERGMIRVFLNIWNTEGDEQLLVDLWSPLCELSWVGGHVAIDEGKDDYPCIEVSWYGAQAYCNFLSDREGLARAVDFTDWSMDLDAHGYRLPTEAEWEYACRAGTTTALYTGDLTTLLCAPIDQSLDVAGWFRCNSGDVAHRVGLKAENPWGLLDMHGNVREWCWDGHETYPDAALDPASLPPGDRRMFRGGDYKSSADSCRSAARNSELPDYRDAFTGFRPVRRAAPQ